MRAQLKKTEGEVNVRRLNYLLIVITAAMTLLYAVFWLWQSLGSRSSSGHLDSIVASNPRPMIVLCFAAAAMMIAFLPEIGKIFAAISLGGALVFYGYWWKVTAGIKSNLGMDKIPGADWLGNLFIGANVVDLGFAAVAILVIGLDVIVIAKNLSAYLAAQNSRRFMSPVGAHK